MFVETTPSAWDLVTGDSLLTVVFQGTFADGSLFSFQIDVTPDGNATVQTHGDGADGVWHTTGFKFTGASDLSSYTVTGDNSKLGISGSMTLEPSSTTAFRMRSEGAICGRNRLSRRRLLGQCHPDSAATINFTIGGDSCRLPDEDITIRTGASSLP